MILQSQSCKLTFSSSFLKVEKCCKIFVINLKIFIKRKINLMNILWKFFVKESIGIWCAFNENNFSLKLLTTKFLFLRIENVMEKKGKISLWLPNKICKRNANYFPHVKNFQKQFKLFCFLFTFLLYRKTKKRHLFIYTFCMFI